MNAREGVTAFDCFETRARLEPLGAVNCLSGPFIGGLFLHWKNDSGFASLSPKTPRLTYGEGG
jgi:hypothetical protein